jgi:hydroxymethylpyrimidine pyrophosphatase-like HAD family hydrolase
VLAEVGIELVFVTARPPRWVGHLADLVGAHGTVICCNGAFVYDVPQRSVIAARGMSPSMARTIAADLRAALPGVGFAVERHTYWSRCSPASPENDAQALVRFSL